MQALVFLVMIVPFLLISYGAVLLFVRPPKAVLLRSLLAGLLVGIVNLLVDLIAYFAGWWHYTLGDVTVPQATAFYQRAIVDLFAALMNTLHVPVPFYLTPIFIYGSLAYLCIWRFWQGRGRWFALFLLLATPLFCIWRDLSGGLNHTSFQEWQNIPLAIAATVIMWLLAFYLGFALFWRKAAQLPFTRDEEAQADTQVSTMTRTSSATE